jgi:hypothetical protein
MSIPATERDKLLRVALCGPRVVRRLEAIGIRTLDELADREPDELLLAVNLSVGAPIWQPPMATRAMHNLIVAAKAATSRPIAVRSEAMSRRAGESRRRYGGRDHAPATRARDHVGLGRSTGRAE